MVVRRRDAFRGDSPFRAYVYGIARFVLVAHIRRRQRHGKRFEPSDELPPRLGVAAAPCLEERPFVHPRSLARF